MNIDIPSEEMEYELDIPTSDQFHQLRKDLAGMNWENHALKLEIKYFKRKLTRVLYGEKPQERPSPNRRQARFSLPPQGKGNADNLPSGDEEIPNNKGPVFGIPLEELLSREKGNNKIPYLPRKLMDLLSEDEVVNTEGLFRLSPSAPLLQEQKDKINQGEPVNWDLLRKDPHTAASLFKQFLRELPNPILTPNDQFMEIHQQAPQLPPKEMLSRYKVLIASLPKANRYMVEVFTKIMANSAKNRMNATALGVIFGSNLMRIRGEGSSDLDRSISRSSGRLSSLMSHSPNSLKEEMMRTQHVNNITATLISNPSVFGNPESENLRASGEFPAVVTPSSLDSKRKRNSLFLDTTGIFLDNSENGKSEENQQKTEDEERAWREGWGWSFQGPKFSIQGEEDKLSRNQHAQYAHFTEYRHNYAQLVRALQAQPQSLAVAGLQLEKVKSRSLASIAASTLYDPLTVDGLTCWRWLAEVVAAWSNISCTKLRESVYGERVDSKAKNDEYLFDSDEEELFQFDEEPIGEGKEKQSSKEVAPALFLAYVLLYYAKSREFIEFLNSVVKPITQNLLSSSLSLNIKFSEDTTEHKRSFLKVELDVEALQTITTSFLEALLTENSISTVPSGIVFVCRLLYKTKKFEREPQLLFRWFFFHLYILSALTNPEEYELFDDVSTTRLQVLRCVQYVLAQIVEVPVSFPCPAHTHSIQPEDEALRDKITKLCENELQDYVMRYRISVDSLGQRIILSPIVLHPLYKPPELTGIVSTSLGEMYMLHRILINLVSTDKGKGICTKPMRLILEAIREPPVLREEDDVFIIMNLSNFISNVTTFTDDGETNSQIDRDGAEVDELSKLATELKRQIRLYEISSKLQRSSMQMRMLNESIRKLSSRLASNSVLIQQVSQDYLQLKDAIVLAQNYKKELLEMKSNLNKQLQLAFLDLLATKQPEDIYPKTTRYPTITPNSPPLSSRRPPHTRSLSIPSHSHSPAAYAQSPSHSPAHTPSHSPTPSQPTYSTALNFLERLNPNSTHLYTPPKTIYQFPLSTPKYSSTPTRNYNNEEILQSSTRNSGKNEDIMQSPNPLASLLSSKFDLTR